MLFRRCSRFQRGVGGYAFLENGGTPLRFLDVLGGILFLEKSDTPPDDFWEPFPCSGGVGGYAFWAMFSVPGG